MLKNKSPSETSQKRGKKVEKGSGSPQKKKTKKICGVPTHEKFKKGGSLKSCRGKLKKGFLRVGQIYLRLKNELAFDQWKNKGGVQKPGFRVGGVSRGNDPGPGPGLETIKGDLPEKTGVSEKMWADNTKQAS